MSLTGFLFCHVYAIQRRLENVRLEWHFLRAAYDLRRIWKLSLRGQVLAEVILS